MVSAGNPNLVWTRKLKSIVLWMRRHQEISESRIYGNVKNKSGKMFLGCGQEHNVDTSIKAAEVEFDSKETLSFQVKKMNQPNFPSLAKGFTSHQSGNGEKMLLGNKIRSCKLLEGRADESGPSCIWTLFINCCQRCRSKWQVERCEIGTLLYIAMPPLLNIKMLF